MEPNVYQSPSSGQSSAGINGPYRRFRNNSFLAALLITGIILDAMFNAFFCMVTITGNTIDIVPNAAQMIPALTSVQLGVAIMCIVLFFAWVNRTCKNAWLLDPPHINITPRMAVGYFFIPVVNLWKPYVAMKQIRKASYGSDHPLSKVLPLWWTSWLVLTVLVFALVMVQENNPTEQGMEIARKLGIIRTPVKLVFYFLSIALIHHLTRSQKARIERRR